MISISNPDLFHLPDRSNTSNPLKWTIKNLAGLNQLAQVRLMELNITPPLSECYKKSPVSISRAQEGEPEAGGPVQFGLTFGSLDGSFKTFAKEALKHQNNSICSSLQPPKQQD